MTADLATDEIVKAIPARRPGTPGGGRRRRALPRLRRRRLRHRHHPVRRRRHVRLTPITTTNQGDNDPWPPPSPESRREDRLRGAAAVRRRRVRRSRATRRSRSSTSTRSTSPSSRRSSRTSTAWPLKGDDVGKIKTVGDAIDLVVQNGFMSREVVITGIGAVTPLGVGARTLHERWSAGVVGIEDGEGVAPEFEPDRAPLRQGGRAAPTASRSSRWSRPTRRSPRPAGDDELPYDADRIGCDHRHRHRRHRHARARQGAADRRAAPKKVPPLSVPLMMSNAAAGARVHALRAARPVARHRLGLRGGRARHRRRRRA